MPDASVANLFRRMAQGVHHYLAESLRICSVYLGIAVIVTVSMGFALPGLRDQALQVHKALLTALAPTSMQAGSESDTGSELSMDSSSAIAMAVPAARQQCHRHAGPARVAAGAQSRHGRHRPAGRSLAQLYFAQVQGGMTPPARWWARCTRSAATSSSIRCCCWP